MGRAKRLRVNIGKTALPTSFEWVVTEQLPLRCLIVGQVWKSNQNGQVYDPMGISPCLTVGSHAGVEPKIVVYEGQDNKPVKGQDEQVVVL